MVYWYCFYQKVHNEAKKIMAKGGFRYITVVIQANTCSKPILYVGKMRKSGRDVCSEWRFPVAHSGQPVQQTCVYVIFSELKKTILDRSRWLLRLFSDTLKTVFTQNHQESTWPRASSVDLTVFDILKMRQSKIISPELNNTYSKRQRIEGPLKSL